MTNTPTRLTKVTDFNVMLEYRQKGRKVRIVQMGDDGRTPIEWWFEPAAITRKRQAAKRKLVTDLSRDLRKAAATSARNTQPKTTTRTTRRSK